jgi:UrcA family protein
MSRFSIPKTIGRSALLASALGLALAASSAGAQDYNDSAPAYRSTSTEEVVVAAPRNRVERSGTTGAPIVDVALQRPVRFDDLDLRTEGGAHMLRERVRFTAQRLCRDLDRRYPITVSGGPSCYREAVDDAMEQAETAIDQARSDND